MSARPDSPLTVRIGRSTGCRLRSKIRAPLARQDRPVALVEISDAPGHRRKRERVRADEHLVVAPADGQRRAVPGSDHQVVMAFEQKGQRERALDAAQGVIDRLLGRLSQAHQVGHHLGNDLGVGIGGEVAAGRGQFLS